MKVRAYQYDTVDALCWRHYGRTQGVTEQVLKANSGLAEYGPFLPHGLQVELPDILHRRRAGLAGRFVHQGCLNAGRPDDWCADAGYQLVLQTQSLPASARRADLAGGL